MKLRCIIVDDEFLARKRLLKLLEAHENIQVVAECRNGNEALEKIALKEPDFIFLDIQMPDMDGFTVYSKLQQKPAVIFTTAYDQYALKAFEINAVDYLLKPFDIDRFNKAVARIIEIQEKKEKSHLEDKVKNLLKTYNSTQHLSEFDIKTKGRKLTILCDDILYFKSDGNYVLLVTTEKKYLYRITMNKLYEQIDKTQFIRIHRSIVLNKIYIKKGVYTNNNEYRFDLKNGEEYTSSRSFSNQISEYLSAKK